MSASDAADANEIAVVHPDFVVSGGAEAVCFATLETLQDDHDLTLFTFTPPDFERLNEYYGTAVDRDRISVRTVGTVVPSVYGRHGKKFGILAASYLARRLRHEIAEYDVTISTKDEFPFADAIQYIHFPRYYRRDLPDDTSGYSFEERLYDKACRVVAGFDRRDIAGSVLLTNSQWTAGVVEDVYGIRPRVVHPPINTQGFASASGQSGRTWADREDGFVSVGRMTPDKNLLRNIEIVTALDRQGHDVHLHIVGPRDEKLGGSYSRTVLAEAANHDCVHVEGEMEFEELAELLRTHKYGLHGKQNEHFGMAVAEMVAAGMIPFVPDSGGQTDVVGGSKTLLYRDAEAAIEQIAGVVSDPSIQAQLREDLPDVEAKYGRKQFRTTMRQIVAEHGSR